MSGLFPSPGTPWFRVGRLEITTSILVVLLVAGSWLAWAILPGGPSLLYFTPAEVLTGQVWRVFTWPLAEPASLWALINLFFFWYFATSLEQQVGRVPMARLLVGIWVALTVAASLVSLLAGPQVLFGIRLVQFVVLLLWLAEYPLRRFVFGIPAWVLGVALIAIQVLGAVASRDLGSLLSLLLGLAFVAVAGRRVGLLTGYRWIPGGRGPRKPRHSQMARDQRRRDSDNERIDALLDQISQQGLNSLTGAQRRELNRLRERRRRS